MSLEPIRLPGYIGRQREKDALRRLTHKVSAEPVCRVLYIEAQGGFGKTRLLELYPQVLAEAGEADGWPPAPAVLATRIIDFYNFESRNPNTIEEQLIQSVLAGAGSQLAPETLGELFQPYKDAVEAMRRTREQGRRSTRDAVEDAFVAGWNSVAGHIPLVIRLDTVENLFAAPPPPDALVNAEELQSGTDLVLGWIASVLPRLRHTLVILSGRPVGGENQLVATLRRLGLLDEPVLVLAEFTGDEEIGAYLSAYNQEVGPEDLAHARAITDGRPLLLTYYAANRGYIPEWVTSRALFEDYIVDTVLNPFRFHHGRQLAENTQTHSIYVMYYARRGLRREELHDLFERLSRPDSSQGMGGLSFPYSKAGIDRLEELALVKNREGVLYLHDEFFLLIDERVSAAGDAVGLKQEVLDYLCELGRQKVRDAERGEVLRFMGDHLYYEMTRDIVRGYRAYAIYIDQLLSERSFNRALVLADTFWSLLYYRVQSHSLTKQPYLDSLLEAAPALTLEEILRDEQVRRVKLLWGQGQNGPAIQLTGQLTRRFVDEGLLPPEGDLEQRPERFDAYLYIDLALSASLVLMLGQGSASDAEVELMLSRAVALLTDGRPIDDPLLQLRRDWFLGLAYTQRGQLRYSQKRYADAEADEDEALKYLRRYRDSAVENPYGGPAASAAEILNDQPEGAIAQLSNNSAYNLMMNGAVERGERRSDVLVQRYGPLVSDYRRALIHSTNGLIKLRAGKYHEARRPAELAEQFADASKVDRAIGLAQRTRAQVERELMKLEGTPWPAIEARYRTARDRLAGEPRQLAELLYDYSGFCRDMALLYQQAGRRAETNHYFNEALGLIDAASTLLPPIPSMERADLLESKATVYNLMGNYAEAGRLLDQAEQLMLTAMPEYGKVVAGKIAMQRAYNLLHTGGDNRAALNYLAVALAYAYLYADHHRDQRVFEELITQRLPLVSQAAREQFYDLVQNDLFYVTVADLPYQRPSSLAWSRAWEKSIQFLCDRIAERRGAPAP